MKPGEIAALLRREGLYSSHLVEWRRARDQGQLDALASKRRGRKPDPDRALKRRNAQLERENARLKRRLERVELMLTIQKKASEMLGIPLNPPDKDEND